MTKMINKLTGGDMWVADSRVEEYKAAGHVLAASPKQAKNPIMNEPEPEAEERERYSSRRRRR